MLCIWALAAPIAAAESASVEKCIVKARVEATFEGHALARSLTEPQKEYRGKVEEERERERDTKETNLTRLPAASI